MTKSLNKNTTYDFTGITKGLPILIKATNPASCRVSAYYYARINGFKVKTWLTDTGVVVLAY